jgi:hypothetical protein
MDKTSTPSCLDNPPILWPGIVPTRREAAGDEALRLAVALVLRQEQQGWTGADPYDGLASPVARLLGNRRLRQGLVQAVRRSPIDLRPLLRIYPRRMVAATGLAATAASRLAADPFWAELRHRLGGWTSTHQVIQGAFRGLWGYEFDVQTRWGYYRAGSPNAIATVIAGNGCLDAGSLHRERRALLGAALLRCFWRGAYFAYTPDSNVLIHNANLLVAALAARLAADGELEVPLREALRRAAASSVETALTRQRPNGSWPYGEDASLDWIDGYHTAYNLLALDDATMLLGGTDSRAALERGARYYFDRLFDGAVPRFLAGRKAGPSDVNNVATGLRAAVWGASHGYAAPEFPSCVYTVLRDSFWNSDQHYVRASANRLRPTARLDYPRWGAAPALDALTALVVSKHEGSSQ